MASRPATSIAVDTASATAAEGASTVTCARRRSGRPLRGSTMWLRHRPATVTVWP